jgi:hypothetical protein
VFSQFVGKRLVLAHAQAIVHEKSPICCMAMWPLRFWQAQPCATNAAADW